MSARVGVVPRPSAAALLRPRPSVLPFPLAEERCTLWSTAVHALAAGLRASGLQPGEELLVPVDRPRYVDLALAATGIRSRSYTVGAAMEPLPAMAPIPGGGAVRALYLLHRLGFPQDARYWQTWCRERGLLLVEDVCQSWAATFAGAPLGSYGDAAVFSLILGLGLPDGAALVSEPAAPSPPRAGWWGIRADGEWPWRASQHANELLFARDTLPGLPQSAPSGAGSRLPSALTLRLLPLLADAHAAVRRRANYTMLLEGLGDRVASGFGSVPESASPLAFPLVTAHREDLRTRLAHAGISTISAPQSALGSDRCAGRPQETLLLPVHQEVRPVHVATMLSTTTGRRHPQRPIHLEFGVSPAALLSDWARLAECAGNVFATQEWAMTWWRHFGAERELCLTACRDPDGRLIALLPLYMTRLGAIRILRFVGHGPADQLGPLCEPQDRPAAARALRQTIRELGADLLLGEQFSAAEGWDARLGAEMLAREPSPVIRFASSDWQELLQAWPRSVSRQIRRRSRQLEREPAGLTYRLSLARDRLAGDMDQLMRLHLSQRGGLPSLFANGHSAFHREFAAVALERGWLRLLLVELEQPVAATYGFDFAGAGYYYNSGRDRAWDHRSVGTLALVESIRLSQAAGMGEYRLLRGGEPYKLRYANADPGLQTVALGRWRASGPAMRLATVARGSLIKPARKWLGR